MQGKGPVVIRTWSCYACDQNRYIAQLERTIEQYKAREKSGGLLGPGGGGAGAANTSFGTPRRDVDDDEEEESSAVRGGAGSADTPAAASVSGDVDTSVVESKEKAETEESTWCQLVSALPLSPLSPLAPLPHPCPL